MIPWTTAAFAGVWVQPPGASYTQVTAGAQWASSVWLPSGEVVPQTDPALLGDLSELLDHGSYEAFDLGVYGELGVAPHLELVGSTALRTAANRWTLAQGEYPDIVQRNTGLGDLTVGGRYGGTRGALAGSVYLTGRLPLYDNRPRALGTGAGNADFEDDQVPLGPGTLDLDLGVGGGWGLARGWALAEVGLRVRSQQFSAVIPARVQLGATPAEPVHLWTGAAVLGSLGNGRAPDEYRDRWGKGPVAIDHQSALTLDAGVQLDLWRGLGVVVSTSRVAWGVRFPVSTSASAGVSWKR